MPYTLPVSFDKFRENIELGGTYRETAKKRRDRLVSLLENNFTILEAFSTGSIPRFTAIKGYADLDKLEPKKGLIFGLNYSYRSVVDHKLKTHQFFIDFIHQDKLGDFIEETIWKEVGELREHLSFKHKISK